MMQYLVEGASAAAAFCIMRQAEKRKKGRKKAYCCRACKKRTNKNDHVRGGGKATSPLHTGSFSKIQTLVYEHANLE
jgi:hypothetical protein